MWVRHLQGWAQGGGGCCVCSLQDVEWDGMIVQHRGRGDRLLSAAAMGINGHDALDNSRPSASWLEIILAGETSLERRVWRDTLGDNALWRAL